MPSTSYDINQVSFTIAGVDIRGGSDSDFVSIETDEDLFIRKAGVDGETWWSKSNNRMAMWTISVMQSSNAMETLNGFKLKDQRDGTGTFTAQIRDVQAGHVLTLTDARIVKDPSIAFGKEIAAVEWQIAGTYTAEFGKGLQ